MDNNKTVLRVGVYNNFNFTDKELSDVKQYEGEYLPFVNSNSFVTIKADYPSIITINPYLDSWQEPVGDLSNLKACRVKWVEGATDQVYSAQMAAVDWCLAHSVPVLLTFMRFKCKASMWRFTAESGRSNYQFNAGYYRLIPHKAEEIYARVVEYAQRTLGKQAATLIYTCDLSGGGCPACGNCTKLTYGIDAPVASLSLSSSGDAGDCIFHCPDCWAKNMGKFVSFKYDQVTINNKQKGLKNSK